MPKARSGKLGWAGAAGAAVLVACCAAGPLLVAFVGSLALGAIVGLGASACLLLAALAALYLRHRTRHATEHQP